ncbi:MAG: NIL domain-containing protein [Nitrospirae bacterium]|nr:NIL domain-containing protein [Nitrospirota bacterium]
MAKRQVRLTFPQDLIREPVIYTMAKECDVIPNIRRAKVTELVGEVVLELEGKEEDLERGIDFLIRKGVKVEPVPGDIVE